MFGFGGKIFTGGNPHTLSLQAVFLYVVKPLPDPSLICRLDFCPVADGEHDSRSVGCNSKKDECFTLGT